MNSKQKLIVSITGITIVMLALLGLTYGYYLTRIQGNTNNNSISITTADLTLKYDDGTSYINLTNIMPGTTTDGENGNPEPKVFTITNDGSGDVEYSVGIDEVTNTLSRTQDLTYSITCVEKLIDAADTSYSACATTPSNSGEYPKTNSYLFTNQIKQDYIQKYTVIISYANPDEDQSIDMGSTIKGRMQIYSVPESIDIIGTVTGATNGDYVQINSNPKTSVIAEDGTYKLIGVEPGIHTLSVKNGSTTKGTKEIIVKQGTDAGIDGNTITFTESERVATVNITSITTNLGLDITKIHDGSKTLKETIFLDSRITKNTGEPVFSQMADYKITGDASSGEIGMYSAEDDYGTSWYFRGAQSHNYVDFAGFTWRIVRINGDGSIRMILSDTLDNAIRDGDTQAAGSATIFSEVEDNASVGYMYGITNADNYDDTHQNLYDSIIKDKVDEFYEKYIENDEKNYHFEQYLSDNLFCGDKELASGYEEYGYDTTDTNYDSYDRLFVKRTPSLKCAEGSKNNYSRYTSKIDLSTSTIKSINVNNDLEYPIALLNADEVLMAGSGYYDIVNNIYNSNYYLALSYETDSYNATWTMTPLEFVNGGDYAGILSTFIFDGGSANRMYLSSRSVRPVINLRSDVLVDTGNGTYDTPYTVKLPNE